MKDKKLRILCIVAGVLSVCAVIPIMFGFYEEYYSVGEYISGGYVTYYGFEIYSDVKNWWYLLVGILGIISLLWNLAYCAYALIDGRYRNLTWRIARYGYFYGVVVGIINFAVIVSYGRLMPAAWIFVALVALTVIVEGVLLFVRDEDSKMSVNND